MEASKCTSRSALLTSSLIALAACSGTGNSPDRPATKTATMVLVGGDVWTMVDQAPRATALAITGNRIVAVGTDAQIRALVGPSTVVVELRGRAVTPGLIDSHAHLYGVGAAAESVDLRGVTSAEAAAKKVADSVADSAAGEWVTGRGWDQNRWAGQEFPTRAVLDAALGDRLVALRRVDGHALWASSAAIAGAGVTAKTADPEGGKIIRDASGEPTGVFVDNAMDLIESKIGPPSREVITRRIRRAAELATAAGLTGVHEMGISGEVAEVYAELAATGELPLRIYAFLSGAELAMAREPETSKTGADLFTVRAFKLFADGALGSRGARLELAYADDANNFGLWVTKPAELRAQIAAGVEKGWQIGVHAIGDHGNRAVLDAFEEALSGGGSDDRRLRVEHAQVLRPEDIGRFAKLGVIASMQPTHATSDMPWAEARLGAGRIRGAYAWRALLETGAHIAAGSDFPVEKVSPLYGLWAATTRRGEDGKPAAGWYADQKMELREAIAAFTREGAYASFSEDQRGSVSVGRLADLTVYDRLLEVSSLLETTVDMTIVGGRVVYPVSGTSEKPTR